MQSKPNGNQIVRKRGLSGFGAVKKTHQAQHGRPAFGRCPRQVSDRWLPRGNERSSPPAACCANRSVYDRALRCQTAVCIAAKASTPVTCSRSAIPRGRSQPAPLPASPRNHPPRLRHTLPAPTPALAPAAPGHPVLGDVPADPVQRIERDENGRAYLGARRGRNCEPGGADGSELCKKPTVSD